MLVSYRQTIFTIFALFYIVTLPFLVFLSLGYDFNFKNSKLTNTLTIKIETYPRGAEIKTYNNSFKTPIELRVSDGKNFQLSLDSKDYLQENFRFSSTENQNSTARILDLWLLPKNSNKLEDFKDKKALGIITNNLLMYEKNDKYFLKSYTFSGLQGDEIEIKKPFEGKIVSTYWQPLLENIFWSKDQDVVLFKSQGNWEFVSIKNLPFAVKNIVKITDSEVLILDTEGSLWSYNLVKKEFSFLDKGYSGLAFTLSPDSIWLYRVDKIYKISRNNISQELLNINNFLYLQNTNMLMLDSSETVLDSENFVVKNLFLGVAFRIKDKLIYVPDSNKKNWLVLAANTKTFGTANSNIFWIDNDKNLFIYDLLLKNQKYIGKLDISDDNLSQAKFFYYPKWSRLFIYSKTVVHSLWYDTRIVNANVANYFVQKWVDGASCKPEIFDNYQFCIKDNNLIDYKNNSLPF